MNAPERGLVTDPACKIALKSLSHMVFGGDAGVVDRDLLNRLHDAHAAADVTAPTSRSLEDGEWVQYGCGCDLRLVQNV